MKLIMLLSVLSMVFSAQAGVIKNKKTGDTIQLEMIEGGKKVAVVRDINGKADRIEYVIKDFKFKSETLTYIYNDNILNKPFGGVSALTNSSEVPTELQVVFFVPAVALDVFLLPISLPVTLFSQSSYPKFKKDMKLIHSALSSAAFEKSVSNKKFERIEYITDFFYEK